MSDEKQDDTENSEPQNITRYRRTEGDLYFEMILSEEPNYTGLGDDGGSTRQPGTWGYSERLDSYFIWGTGTEHLTTGGNDAIFGFAGTNYIRADGGNDVVWAGDGSDIVWGEAGDDLLIGNAGRDLLLGGQGNDTLYGSNYSGNIPGWSWEDSTEKNPENLALYALYDSDRLHGEGGNDDPGQDL